MELKNNNDKFVSQIEKQTNRKMKNQNEVKKSAWLGFALFGIIGWSIVVPTLLGVVLGKWLDKKYPQTFSWTLTFLLTGLLIGCLVAWNWLKKEHFNIQQKKEKEENE